MSNTVKKLVLEDMHRIGRNESWFADMAKEGLHLKKFGRVFAEFEKGEPRHMKYRIDILENAPEPEQLLVYQDSGWDFVASTGNFYIFSSPESRNAKEIHTDPIEQSYTLEYLQQKMKKSVIAVAACMLLFFGMMYFVIFHDATPVLSLVKGHRIQQIILVILESYVFYIVLRSYFAIRALKQSLSQGVPLNHSENWKQSRRYHVVVTIVIYVIALLTIVQPIMLIATQKAYTLPEHPVSSIPAVRLAEIEQTPGLIRESGRIRDDVDFLNSVEYQRTLLAPLQYEINEHGIVPDELWDDGSGEYGPSVRTYYYQLTSDWFADGLIKDLIRRYNYRFYEDTSSTEYTEQVQDSYFDRLYVFEKHDEINKQIYASVGNIVIFVNYYGNADSDHIIDKTREMLMNHSLH